MPCVYLFPLACDGGQEEHPLHVEAVNPLNGGELGAFLGLAHKRVSHFQLVFAMGATDVFAFSLIVELLSAVAAGAFVPRCAERNVAYRIPYRPFNGFRANGGQLHVGSRHRLFKSASRFHGSEIVKK